MGGVSTKCWRSQPPYARYQSNSKLENELDLENVLGSLLEMDPAMQDRDEGVSKINTWIDDISAEIHMSGPQLEISRWKCIKYWEAQHVSDVYSSKDQGLKLTGSSVRFYFENTHQEDTLPRLVIEHCGKSLQLKKVHSGKSGIPMWIKNMKSLKWKPFQRKGLPVDRQGSFVITNNDHAEMLTTRNG